MKSNPIGASRPPSPSVPRSLSLDRFSIDGDVFHPPPRLEIALGPSNERTRSADDRVARWMTWARVASVGVFNES